MPIEPVLPTSLTFHAALPALVGLRSAAWIDFAFALTSLAPACYAAFLFGSRLYELRPHVTRSAWTLLGAIAAWALAISGALVRMFDVFSVIGALLAPVAGAMAADYVRSKGRWPGGRRGVNVAGYGAWVLGVVIGLTPYLARMNKGSRLENLQPAAVFAFLAAFVVYWVVAMMGAEPAVDTRVEPAVPADAV